MDVSGKNIPYINSVAEMARKPHPARLSSTKTLISDL